MIIKKIRALIDTTLNTTIELIPLVKGEVAIVKFKDMTQFDGLQKLGVFVEADIDEPVKKEIPVIRREGESKVEDDSSFVLENNLTNRINELMKNYNVKGK
jgi:hypothetical protein